MGDTSARDGPASLRVHSGSAPRLAGTVGCWLEGSRLLERVRLLAGWTDVLADLGIDDRTAMLLAERARANRTCFHSELLVSGRVGEDAFFGAMARTLGLRFFDRIPADRLVVDDSQAITALRGMRRGCIATLRGEDGAALFVIAPRSLDLPVFRAQLRAAPGLAKHLAMTTPAALRQALLARAEPTLAREAALGLFGRAPDYSARFVTNPWQAFATGLLVAGTPVLLYVAPKATALALSAVLTVLFLGCIGLRLLAGLRWQPLRAAPAPPPHRAPPPG